MTCRTVGEGANIPDFHFIYELRSLGPVTTVECETRRRLGRRKSTRRWQMERRAIAIQGTVQGVGFRPFVFGLACRLNLRGFVHNSTGGVRIEVEGESPRLDQFLSDLTTNPPPLARIDDLVWERRPPLGESDFRIETSAIEPGGPIVISPDVATCDACLAELFDPSDRRYRYPFLNCTNCGPRLTIVQSSLRSRADDDGLLPDVRRLPRRIRKSSRSALSCTTHGMPGLRTAPHCRKRRAEKPSRSPIPCAGLPMRCARAGSGQ